MATIDYNARHAARIRSLVRALWLAEATDDLDTYWRATQQADELMAVLDLNQRELDDVHARVEDLHRAERTGA